jgi:outer membrane immunogenic protein
VKWFAFAGVLLAVFCVTGVARAGDAAAYKAPPPAAGAMPGNFYVGLSLGARWSDTDWTTTAIGFPPPSPPFANPASFDSSSARIGGYAGYMWRIAPTWAVGIEGDIAWGDSSKNVPGIPGTCCGGIAGVREGWDGGIRGRLGFLLTPSWLLYATGGIAWQGLELDASCGAGKGSFCASSHAESVSSTQAGWTLGTGIEVMLRHNWLVRLEYRFADYGRLDHTFFVVPATDRVVMDESLTTQTLLLGVAYKLSPPPAVVSRH